MFDFSFSELLVIAVIALVVLGPERLPTAARTAGLWLGKIKRTVANVQQEITSQLEAEELRRKLDDHQKRLDEGLSRARSEVEQLGDQPDKPRPAEPEPPAVGPLASSEVKPEEPSMPPGIVHPPSPEGASDHGASDVRPETSSSDNVDKDTAAR